MTRTSREEYTIFSIRTALSKWKLFGLVPFTCILVERQRWPTWHQLRSVVGATRSAVFLRNRLKGFWRHGFCIPLHSIFVRVLTVFVSDVILSSIEIPLLHDPLPFLVHVHLIKKIQMEYSYLPTLRKLLDLQFI